MKRLVLALLLLPALAQAQAFRLGKGLQLVPTATAPTKAAGNGEVYIDSGASNVLKYKNPAGTVITLGAAGAGTGYATIDDEGGALTQRTILNFTGSGVSCVDNAGATRTDCTISSGGSTGNWTFASDAADDSGANVLTIGATTATGVTLSRTAGTITMAGATVFAANKGVTVTAGTSAFDFSGGSGLFKTSTGAATFGGSSNTFSAGLSPSVDNAINLGDSTHRWGTVYSSNLTTSGTLIASSTASSVYVQAAATLPVYIKHGGSVSSAQFFDYGFSLTPVSKTSGYTQAFYLGGAANTGQTASTEVIDFHVDLARTMQHATGAITTQRAAVISAPTYSFVGASTITNAATLAVTAAPAAGTNATITNAYSIWSQDGSGRFQRDGVGTTVGTAGLLIDNSTAATVGAQKYSPALIWSGNGWKTNATAGSQSVQVAAQLVPIQGAANPTQQLVFYESINGGGWNQTEINGSGYFGSNDQQALGTAATSSTTFVDVGNGTSTGFASWTAPTTKVTKTYVLHVSVRTYLPTAGPSVTTYFQVLQDGAAISGQPTASASQSFGTTTSYLQTTWRIAVPCVAGTAHVYKLQWKVGNAGDQAGVTATVGTLQYFIEG